MIKKILTISTLSFSMLCQAQSSIGNMSISSTVENSCIFSAGNLFLGNFSVGLDGAESTLVKEGGVSADAIINGSFNYKCTKDTIFNVKGQKATNVNGVNGSFFVHMYGSKPNNKDYLGFHIWSYDQNNNIVQFSTPTDYLSSKDNLDVQANGEKQTFTYSANLVPPKASYQNINYYYIPQADIYSAPYTFYIEY